MKFNTQFDHPSPALDNRGEKSLAHPEFADEANLENIVKRYQVTGYLVDPSVPRRRQPMFGDFTNVPTAQEAYNKLISARQAFDDLPEAVRREFDGDPMRLLAFLDNPKNREKAVALGLIANKDDETAPASKEPSQAAPAAVAT